MENLDIDSLIQIADKEFTLENVRKCPRNQYGHVHIDPLLKFWFKYQWHVYCTKFVCRDLETGQKAIFSKNSGDGSSILLQSANWLMERSSELGIPVVEGGLISYHNEVDANDRYFTAEIVLDYKGRTIKERKSTFETYSNRK